MARYASMTRVYPARVRLGLGVASSVSWLCSACSHGDSAITFLAPWLLDEGDAQAWGHDAPQHNATTQLNAAAHGPGRAACGFRRI
ncbi:MAG TPA: hypothetical protein VGU23_10155 [Acidobacteriaceae bacterium]|nr:hypothetical protein [Acidobacteriaceae bacterium]